jgi:hypothetical protein
LIEANLFEEATAAFGHARQRFFGDVHGNARLLSQQLIQTFEECPTTC